MDIVLRHDIEYEVRDSVAVEDLIHSVQANARLLRSSVELLAGIVPGLNIDPKQVSVRHLSQESPLREAFAIAVVLTYQKKLEEEVPELVEVLTGARVSEQYDTLVTVLAMLIAIYGISKAFDLLFPARSKVELDQAREGLVKRAARLSGVAASRIAAAVELLFTGRSKRALVGASQKVFAPTRGQRAAIRDTRGEVLVPEPAVRDAQDAAGLPYIEDEENEPRSVPEYHNGVRIILHAMDKDRKRRGWAGHCPDLFDDRIPMHLEKSIEPDSIFGRDEIRGDILLTTEEDEDGEFRPKEFLLIRAYL